MFFSVLSRLLRHLLLPMVVFAINQGWLPEAAQEDAVELLLIFVTSSVVLGWSYFREVKVRGKALKDILNGPD